MKTLNSCLIFLLLSTLFYSCNKNENAPVVYDQEFNLAENSEAGTIVGAVDAIDADEGQVVSYEIVDGNSEETFEINSRTGIISVANSSSLDYEHTRGFLLVVVVSDNHDKNPLESAGAVKINLTDINEFAPVLNATVIEVNENPLNGLELARLVATDQDIHQELIYSIVEGNDSGICHIEATSGLLTVLDSTGFDYEKTSELNLVVKVEDNHTSPQSDTARITLIINDVLEITDGLMGYYPFDGNAFDESGNENHGEVVQAMLTNDQDGQASSAYSFDGDGDYIRLGDDFDFQERSISLRFKANQVPIWDYENNSATSWASLITTDHAGLIYGLTRIAISNIDGEDKIWAWVGGMGGALDPRIFCVDFDRSQWQHISLTVSVEGISLFLNGALVQFVSTYTNIHSVDGIPNMMVGTSRGANNRYFEGIIDEIYVHNRALLDTEVQSLSSK